MRFAIALFFLALGSSLHAADSNSPGDASKLVSLQPSLTQVSSRGADFVVEIKNISTVTIGADEDFCCEIWIKDPDWHRLRALPDPRSLTRAAGFRIEPGQTVSYPISLTAAEVSRVGSSPTKCRFYFSTGKAQYILETEPRKFSDLL